jgi:hypothetical protein
VVSVEHDGARLDAGVEEVEPKGVGGDEEGHWHRGTTGASEVRFDWGCRGGGQRGMTTFCSSGWQLVEVTQTSIVYCRLRNQVVSCLV